MNIILITVDCLRADHLSSLGYAEKTTPNLDRFAKEGVLFTRAFSFGSCTLTSVAPLLLSSPTARYYLHGSTKAGDAWSDRYRETVRMLNGLKISLPRALRMQSYETAAFHSNAWLSGYYGFGEGFSHFDDSFTTPGIKKDSKMREKGRAVLIRNRTLYKLLRRIDSWIYRNAAPYERAKTINKKVVSWLKMKKPDKFFVWIHYMDTHEPYKPPKAFRPNMSSIELSNLNSKFMNKVDPSNSELKQLMELYDGGIRYVDHEIKHLIDELDEMEILEDTIIIITADHGEEFGEHEGFMHHPTKLYDELTHVPLIILNSGYRATIDEPVSLIDIAPTIMDLLNLPNAKTFQGKSLIPVINGKESYGIVSEGLDPDGSKMVVAYRTKRWKCILDEVRNTKELYNLEEDPKESNNLYEVKRDIAEDLESRILAHISHQRKLVAMDIERERIRRRIKGKGLEL
jgi:arylsulfatase A-like enzyme